MRRGMRAVWLILAGFALMIGLSATASAQEKTNLPQAVTALCAKRYPEGIVAAFDGWGDEERGQFALVIQENGVNVLCIAEKSEVDEVYAFTVENRHAVYQRDIVPSLLIDTGGDSLFYTYPVGEGWSEHYHAVKENGVWGDVDCITYEKQGDGYRGYSACLTQGALCYEVTEEDELGNILSCMTYMPVPVSPEYEESMTLCCFDIEKFANTPYSDMVLTSGLADGLTEAEDTLLALDLKPDSIVMAVRKADGSCRVRIAQEDGTFLESGWVSDTLSLDTFHAGIRSFILNAGDKRYGFRHEEDGKWRLDWLWAKEELTFCIDGVKGITESSPGRNDGIVYGNSPWEDLEQLDFSALPETLNEAVAQIDQSAYALVNNPDPKDRLHLREKPDRSSGSLGKFYNRTPVRILSRKGDWVHVRIGKGDYCLEGYMMAEFLAFTEEEKAALACAFPQKSWVIPENAENGVRMRVRPGGGYCVPGEFYYTLGDYIIGVVGDDWYVVMREDGSVGYVAQELFWEGNG